MAGRFVRSLGALVLALGAVAVNAADLGHGKYEVYWGDTGDDGYHDIYLHGLDQFILLHGDIATPILTGPYSSFIFESEGRVPECVDPVSSHCPVLEERFLIDTPTDIVPRYSDSEIQNFGLTKLVENYDYFWGDFDGNGTTDLLLVIKSSGSGWEGDKLLMVSGGASTSEAAYAVESNITIDMLEYGIISNPSNFTVRDADGDGRDELVAFIEVGIADAVYNFSFSQGQTLSHDVAYDETHPAALPTTLVGSSGGAFRVDESGNATYTVGIAMPEGVAGVKPSVSLNYASLGGAGIAGIGWRLAAGSSITRCHATKFADGVTKPLKFNDEDKFCMDGQRLQVVSGEYGAVGSEYKTEIDSYQFIYAVGGTAGNPAYFEVVSKDGTLRRYGSTPDSVLDINGNTLIWAVSNIQDNFNNAIDYKYLGGAVDHRIDEITYAGGAASVKFHYQGRPDIQQGYVFGELTQSTKRLDRIDVTNDGSVYRSYQLSYQTVAPNNRNSRLFRVQECTEIGSNCLPPLEFDWSTQGTDFSTTYNHEFTPAPSDSNTLIEYKPADINGDGCLDLIFGWIRETNQEVYFRTTYSLSTDNCTDYLPIQSFLDVQHTSSMPLDLYDLSVVDLNADGRSDIAVRYNDDTYWSTYLSLPNSDGEWRFSSIGYGTPFSDGVFLDYDGDGLIDNIGNERISRTVKLTEPHPTTGSFYNFVDQANAESINEPNAVGDFNGDGAVDFVEYQFELNSEPQTRASHGNGTFKTQTRTLTVKVNTDSGLEEYATYSSVFQEFCYDVYMGEQCVTEAQDIAEPHLHFQPVVQDVNADGLADLIIKRGNEFFLHINSGQGFLSAKSVPVSATVTGHTSSYQETIYPSLVDYNRDGNTDLYWIDRDENSLRVSTWNPIASEFDEAKTIRTNVSDFDSYAIFDLNGDDALDLVQLVNAHNPSNADKKVRIYQGTDTSISNVITKFSNNFGAVTHVTYEHMNTSANYYRTTVHETGDIPQLTDHQICLDSISTLGPWHPVCEELGLFDFEDQMNNPFDFDTTEDEYFRPVYSVNTTRPLVTRVDSSAPVPGDVDAMVGVEYLYTNLRVQAGGRGSLGFETLTAIDLQTGVSTLTEYHQEFPFIGMPKSTLVVTEEGEILKESTNEYVELDSGHEGVYQPKLFRAQQIEYPTYYSATEDDKLTVGAEALSTSTVETTYDNRGNLISSVSSMSGTLPDPEDNSQTISFTQEKTTTNTYMHYVDGVASDGNVLLHGRNYTYGDLGRITNATSTGSRNGVSQLDKEVAFTYDAQGMLDTEIVEPGIHELSERLVKKRLYDAFGNTVETRSTGWDGNQEVTRSARVEYDTLGRYVEKTYDGNGNLIEQVLTRNTLGQATLSAVANGGQATTQYDDLGRKVSSSDNTATGNGGTIEYLNCSQVTPACPQELAIQYAVRTSYDVGSVAIEYFDRLGRPVQTAKLDFQGLWVFTRIEYDLFGRVARKSQPFYTNPEYWTSTEYDMLDRVISISVPATDNSFAITKTEYNGLVTTVTSPNNQTKRETRNLFGELVKVEDNVHDTQNTYADIRYTYDIEGRLTATTMHPAEGGTIVTTLGYDRLGRKTSMNDPDKGNWSYAYNAFGELIYQKDAKGQVVRNRYDNVGRLDRRIDYKNEQETQVEQATHWYFDGATDDSSVTIANAIGQTTAMIMSKGEIHTQCDQPSVQYCQYPSFDQFGRAVGTTTYINSDNDNATPREVFTTSVTYDPVSGNVDETRDAMHGLVKDAQGVPIASGSKAHYNERGYLSHTTDLQYPDQELYRTVSTNVRGQVIEAEVGPYGRKLVYDDVTGSLTKQIAYVGGLVGSGESPDAFTIQHISYEWDIVGNLKSRHNQSSMRDNGDNSINRNLEEHFCYDEMNRLIKTNIGSGNQDACSTLTQAQQDMQFDSVGNVTFKAGVGAYTYHANRPHAVRTAGSADIYNYDNNGNLTSDGSRTLTYSTFDKPLSITKGNHTSTFEYGPDRSRYLHIETNSQVTEKNSTTVYLGGVERVAKGSTFEWRRNVVGGLRTYTTDASLNMLGDEVQRYIFKDHLGSVDVIADEYGNLEQSMSFDPWGARRKEDSNLTLLTASELFDIGMTADTDITTRGYTGHEMLDELGLIHMNGRIYDPRIARFVQADPYIQAANNTQMYNRYSYLSNNPLNATDPSGYFRSPLDHLGSVAREFGFSGAPAALSGHIGGAYAIRNTMRWISRRPELAQWTVTIATAVSAYFCGACSIGVNSAMTADMTYYSTGDFAAGFNAGGRAAIYSTITWGIGRIIPTGGNFVGNLSKSAYVSKVVMHAMVGGVMSRVNGGSFGNGFLSAGVSAGVSSLAPGGDGTGSSDPNKLVQGMLVSAISGGTASALSGGKFANGAVTGALIYLLNSQTWKDPKARKGSAQKEQRSLYDEMGDVVDYERLNKSNPVEMAAWEKYSKDVYLSDDLSIDKALNNFKPIARDFAKERYLFLEGALKDNVLTGIAYEAGAKTMIDIGARLASPYASGALIGGGGALEFYSQSGTLDISTRLIFESKELSTLMYRGPQVFR